MKRLEYHRHNDRSVHCVAFTPKGGCPLKRGCCEVRALLHQRGSIHPQGWVPIETGACGRWHTPAQLVAFTPKGGCPLKLRQLAWLHKPASALVAFTPKGGCPLKHSKRYRGVNLLDQTVAFTPKGGCPLKRIFCSTAECKTTLDVAFTPKGGCPLKLVVFTVYKGSIIDFGSIHPQGWVPIETR